jgi:hypothetical protein
MPRLAFNKVMIVQIEKVDDKNFIVRCVQPPSPPFKSLFMEHSAGKAAAAAIGMLTFPNKTPEAKSIPAPK